MENYNPFSLLGKTILVTGASSGIGRSVAIECSKIGANLIIVGRNSNRLNEVLLFIQNISPMGLHCSFQTDLTDDLALKELVSELPLLDGVVHCAGILKKIPFKFINRDEINRMLDTNFYSPALLSQAIFRKKLLKEESSIVFVSSIASHVASFGSTMYMASKGALNSMVRGVALELSEKRIRANCIEPGLIKTNLTLGALTIEDLEGYEKKYPLGRFGEPEEIAYAAIYLLSDASKWITGTTITVDGGITLR
ncbi:MAG: SDR family oxidoreductase [Bacteroidales bacterium]